MFSRHLLIVAVIAVFSSSSQAPADWTADFNISGDVGVKDLLFLLGAWGPCP